MNSHADSTAFSRRQFLECVLLGLAAPWRLWYAEGTIRAAVFANWGQTDVIFSDLSLPYRDQSTGPGIGRKSTNDEE